MKSFIQRFLSLGITKREFDIYYFGRTVLTSDVLFSLVITFVLIYILIINCFYNNKYPSYSTIELTSFTLVLGLSFQKLIKSFLSSKILNPAKDCDEEKLFSLKKAYQNLFENNLFGIVIIGKKMEVLEVNHAFCKMLGYSKEEIIKNSILDQRLQNNSNHIDCFQKLYRSEIKEFIIENTFTRKDGFPLHTIINVAGTYDNNNVIQNIHCSILDVTERKTTEKQFATKSKIIEGLVNNLPALYYRFDKDLILKESVGAGLVSLGQENNQLVGESIENIFAGYTSVIENHKKAIAGGVAFFEAKIDLKDQEKTHLDIRLFYDQSTQQGIGVAFDTTGKKKIEMSLLKKQKQYKTIFENAFDGIMVFDTKKMEIVEANKKIKSYFKLNVKRNWLNEFLKYTPEFQPNGQKSKLFLAEKINDILTQDKLQYICSFLDHDGKLLEVEISSIKLPYPMNHLVVSIFKDVTELKEQEKIIKNTINEINNKNLELEKYIKSNGELENFAYMASHDLKAPLRTITSYSRLLAKRTKSKLDKIDSEYFNFIIEASEGMSNLIENLLNYSRVNSQKKNFEKVNITNLLEVITLELDTDINEKNVEIFFDRNSKIVIADRTRLKQLFQNMISNAIKFMKPENSSQIYISYEENETHFQFSVKDNGIGIRSEFHDKIFMLFRKLNDSEGYEGTGIGLALCKKIVEQHNGKIWLESTYGEGTTFFFTIDKHLENERLENVIPQLELNPN